MATIVQRRRGTTAQHAGFTGALGEITIDTDKDVAVVHDGVTPGGFPLAGTMFANIFTQTQSIQGGNLDVEGTGEFVTNEILLDATGLTVGDVSLTNPTFLGMDGSVVAADGEFTISALGVVDVGGNLIHNVTDPAAAQDAATKNYVDTTVGAGAPPFTDTTPLVKGSVTPSKLLRFEVDGFTAATTRVVTPPDADITLAGINISQTFTPLQLFTDGIRVGIESSLDDTDGLLIGIDMLGLPTQLTPAGSARFASGTFTISAAGVTVIGTIDSVPLTLTQSVSGSGNNEAFFVVPTWDTSGSPIAIRLNVLDIASGAASLLMDLQVGSVSKFSVSKTGATTITAALDMSSNLINNVTNPVSAQDAATKSYVDGLIAAGAPPFIDSTALVKGSADATKLMRFEVDGFTTATTRVLTPPNADITLAGINIANAWADGVTQTFNPNGTSSGINVGAHTADPSALVNGDIWYQSTANELRARINGVSVALGVSSMTQPYRAISGTDTFSATDYTINATSGTFTLNLPTAVGITGRIYVAKNSGAGIVTLDADGGELIDGLTTQTINPGASLTVQSTGAGWIII